VRKLLSVRHASSLNRYQKSSDYATDQNFLSVPTVAPLLVARVIVTSLLCDLSAIFRGFVGQGRISPLAIQRRKYSCGLKFVFWVSGCAYLRRDAFQKGAVFHLDGGLA
jgi:hypothetical protein